MKHCKGAGADIWGVVKGLLVNIGRANSAREAYFPKRDLFEWNEVVNTVISAANPACIAVNTSLCPANSAIEVIFYGIISNIGKILMNNEVLTKHCEELAMLRIAKMA